MGLAAFFWRTKGTRRSLEDSSVSRELGQLQTLSTRQVDDLRAILERLQALPVEQFKLDQGELAHGGRCGICCCTWEVDEVLRLLPCTHAFHKDCIDVWFAK